MVLPCLRHCALQVTLDVKCLVMGCIDKLLLSSMNALGQVMSYDVI